MIRIVFFKTFSDVLYGDRAITALKKGGWVSAGNSKNGKPKAVRSGSAAHAKIDPAVGKSEHSKAPAAPKKEGGAKAAANAPAPKPSIPAGTTITPKGPVSQTDKSIAGMQKVIAQDAAKNEPQPKGGGDPQAAAAKPEAPKPEEPKKERYAKANGKIGERWQVGGKWKYARKDLEPLHEKEWHELKSGRTQAKSAAAKQRASKGKTPTVERATTPAPAEKPAPTEKKPITHGQSPNVEKAMAQLRNEMGAKDKPKESSVQDKLPGGKADKVPDEAVPQKELFKGTSQEMEHTKDPQIAKKEIAKDHIVEDKHAYDKGEGATEKPAISSNSPNAKLPDGTSVRFIPHERATDDDYEMVAIDPKKFDAGWSKDKSGYIPTNGRGKSEIGGRRDGFKRFLATGEPIQTPIVNMHDGMPIFEDGRHRFAVMRDMGIDRIFVTAPKNDAAMIREKYGSGTHPDELKGATEKPAIEPSKPMVGSSEPKTKPQEIAKPGELPKPLKELADAAHDPAALRKVAESHANNLEAHDAITDALQGKHGPAVKKAVESVYGGGQSLKLVPKLENIGKALRGEVQTQKTVTPEQKASAAQETKQPKEDVSSHVADLKSLQEKAIHLRKIAEGLGLNDIVEKNNNLLGHIDSVLRSTQKPATPDTGEAKSGSKETSQRTPEQDKELADLIASQKKDMAADKPKKKMQIRIGSPKRQAQAKELMAQREETPKPREMPQKSAAEIHQMRVKHASGEQGGGDYFALPKNGPAPKVGKSKERPADEIKTHGFSPKEMASNLSHEQLQALKAQVESGKFTPEKAMGHLSDKQKIDSIHQAMAMKTKPMPSAAQSK